MGKARKKGSEFSSEMSGWDTFLRMLGILFTPSVEEEYLPNKKVDGGNYFAKRMLILAAAVMKADGKLDKPEHEAVKKFLIDNFGKGNARGLISNFMSFLDKDIPTIKAATTLKNSLDNSSRLHLLNFLYKIASADRIIKHSELIVLNQIGKELGLNKIGRESIQAMFYKYISDNESSDKKKKSHSSKPPYRAVPLTTYYDILEIPKDADEDEIKKSFRRLAMIHHPDKVFHLGKDHQKIAREKFMKIKEAYEKIKKSKGFN